MAKAYGEEQRKLQIVTGNYPPWSSYNYKHGGFVHHVITEAFKRQGYQVEFTYYPWARNYKVAQMGGFHASAFWAYSADKDVLFFYSNRIYRDDTVLFHLNSFSFPGWKTYDDLSRYQIGVTRGYTYSKEIWDAHENKKLKLIVSNNDEINFKMLLKRRIDLFMMTEVAGSALLHDKFALSLTKNITYYPKPLVSSGGSLIFPRIRQDAELLMHKFNTGLQALKSDGTYDRLYDQLLAGYYLGKNTLRE